MDRQEVIDQVEKYIYQSLTYKGEIESNKLEFKRSWFNLKTDEIYKCVKHLTGIANSLGGGDGFLVFGYDTKEQTFHQAVLANSGFDDPTEIYGVINRRISNDVSFEVIDHIYNGNPISIVHILPSISKPHMLPNYKDIKTGKESRHVTFIRNGAKTDIATKEDFERMYMDRTNIFVAHKLEVIWVRSKMKIDLLRIPVGNGKITAKFRISTPLTFENLGTRPLTIKEINFRIVNIPYLGDVKVECQFELNRLNSKEYSLKIIPNELLEKTITFTSLEYDTLVNHRPEVESYISKNINIEIDQINFISLTNKALMPSITFS